MGTRPKIKIELTPIDKIIEILGWLCLGTVWVLEILRSPRLSNYFQIHYNATEAFNGLYIKNLNYSSLVSVTFTFVALTILNRFPNIFNYPVPITEHNAGKQYINATRMIRYLKLVIVFSPLVGNGSGTWTLPLFTSALIIPTLFFVIKSLKMK